MFRISKNRNKIVLYFICSLMLILHYEYIYFFNKYIQAFERSWILKRNKQHLNVSTIHFYKGKFLMSWQKLLNCLRIVMHHTSATFIPPPNAKDKEPAARVVNSWEIFGTNLYFFIRKKKRIQIGRQTRKFDSSTRKKTKTWRAVPALPFKQL